MESIPPELRSLRPDPPGVLFVIFGMWCMFAVAALAVLVPLELFGLWSGYPSANLRWLYLVVMAGSAGYMLGRHYRR